MDKACRIIYDTYFEPAKTKNYEFIGMEFECPVYPEDTGISLRKLGNEYLSQLVEEKGCEPEIRGNDGLLVRVKSQGDAVSYDVHYAAIEFSIRPCRSLCEIKERFITHLEDAQRFYRANHCRIVGIGNFYPYKDESDHTSLFPSCLPHDYTNDDFYTMVRDFFANGLGFREGIDYIINMCSTQTHLDIPLANLLDTFNLLNGLTFVRGLLFSNSPWNSPHGMYYCGRDLCWKLSRNPSTGIHEHFSSIEEMCRAISEEEIYLTVDPQGNPAWFPPVTLREFFNVQNAAPEMIQYFRSFKNTIVNKYHCVEIREDCTQPFEDCMVTGAFNLAMGMGYREAAEKLSVFKRKAGIAALSNAELRERSIKGKLDVDRVLLRNFLWELYTIAEQELRKRNYGEELYLLPLKDRIDRLECPAQRLIQDCLDRDHKPWRDG